MSKVWTSFATARASKNILTGDEALAARSVQSEATTRFWTWAIDGVTTDMRLVETGVSPQLAYDIEYVMYDNAISMMEISAILRNDATV